MPRTMAPSPQRLPKALLVALLTALVFGGLVGTVSAADGQADGVPAQLALPSPAVGDRWTYQAVLEGPWAVGSDDRAEDGVAVGRPFPYAEFAWLEPAVVRDGAGREAAVDRLAASTLRHSGTSDWWSAAWTSGGWGDWFSTTDFSDEDLWIPAREVLLLHAGTDDGLAVEAATESYGEEQSQANATAGGVPVQAWDVETVTGWGRTFEAPTIPCMARWNRQGTAIATAEGLWMPDTCLPDAEEGSPFAFLWGFGGEDGEDPLGVRRYEAAAAETVAGHRTVRFDSGSRSVWLSPEVPVPVQWSRGGPQSATVTLTSWSGGSGGPLGQALGRAGQSVAPPVEFAPRQVWGPDDSGVAHPYPASAAFQGALADPTWPDLRDWMDQHPGAFTFLLEYDEDAAQPPHQRQWLFALTDGGGTFAFVATQSSLAGTPLPPVARHEEVGWTAGFLETIAPDPDTVPDLLPTVASVQRRWESYEALEGRQEAANGWAMVLQCPVGCFDWTTFVPGYGGPGGSWPIPSLPGLAFDKVGYAEVVAGKDPIALVRAEDLGGFRPSSLVPGLPGNRTYHGSQLTVDGEGATTRLIQWTGHESSGARVGPLSTQQAVPPGALGGEGDSGRGRAILAAFLPSPEQGAAITIVSGLAGLLYWLWPTLKGGAAGLFSRVTGPRLLEHPARARLHALVEAEPGIHFQDLVRKSGLANGTAVHHLQKLGESGLVAARPLGRYTCYFPGASVDRASLAAAPVTRAEGARRILAEVAANPGLSGLEVATRLGLQPSTVAYHVKRLQEAGLVAAQRDGRAVRLRATGVGGAGPAASQAA